MKYKEKPLVRELIQILIDSGIRVRDIPIQYYRFNNRVISAKAISRQIKKMISDLS